MVKRLCRLQLFKNKIMSLRSWIASVEAKIATLFTSTENEVKNVILPAAIKVTNIIKTVTDFDKADIIGTLAGAGGAAIEEKIKAVLPVIILDLQLSQQFLGENHTPDELIAKVVKIGKGLTGNAKASFLIEFSGQLASALADGKLTIAESVLLTQELYAELK